MGLVAATISKRSETTAPHRFSTMARKTKTFRIIIASTGEPVPGLPEFRSFSAAHSEAGHVQSSHEAALSVGTFSN